MFYALLALTALICSYTGVALYRRWAEQRILDIPNERSSHTRPTPRGGGLALVFVTLIGLIAYNSIEQATPWLPLLVYLVSAILIATISWLDDLRSLSSSIRFAAHGIAALVAVVFFGVWNTVTLPVLGTLTIGWLVGGIITFLWIVGLTNAYNFMDGIDGIAGGQAVVAGLGWATIGWLNNVPLVFALGLFICASSLGFLGHNWPPAHIFMGDVGSAFLGYTFAILPLLHNNATMPLVGLLLVWPFVFDTVFTFVRRLLKGENVFSAHRSHLYQRLVIAGYSHQRVALTYIGLAAVGGVLAIAWYLNLPGSNALIILTIPLFAIDLWWFVWRAERPVVS